MARLYPTDVFDLPVDPRQESELQTLKLLGERLPEEYSVFHGLHWADSGKHNTRFGEIDFVVINRSGSILVIEQKNGGLDETEQGLIKNYGNQRKSVTTQLQRNIGGLRSKFSDQHSDGLEIDYLIYCPDHKVVAVNGVGIDMSRTVDSTSKAGLAERIMQLLPLGSTENSALHDRIWRFFANTFHVMPNVGAFVSAQEQTYTRMLDGLAETIDKLDFDPFRLRVVGTAGCGKTQLTLRLAATYLAQDRKVLQVCFNRPLADKLRLMMPQGVTVDTYYGFCQSTLQKLGYAASDSSFGDPEYWARLQEQLVASTIPDAVRFDALIVDEGQDFAQEWWDILGLFLKDDAKVIWLEDPLQNLRGTPGVELPGFVTYRETANFRTPATIAQFIKLVLGVDFEQKNPLPGLGVMIESVKDSAALTKQVAHRINELVRMGFAKSDIAVVSCRGLASASLAGVDQVGSHSLKRFTGGYCDGAQVYSQGDIYFDSIYRFKGQQSPAVILVDLDERLDRSERNQHVLYCAMTRATVRLELLVDKANPWLDEFQANV